MAFDMNNFVIDRVVRGVALSQTDDSVMFALNQITNPSLSCSSESTDAVDALGVPIATFYRAKNAEFQLLWKPYPPSPATRYAMNIKSGAKASGLLANPIRIPRMTR